MSGIKWKFTGDTDATDVVDNRLVIGATKTPSIFRRLSQIIKRCRKKEVID